MPFWVGPNVFIRGGETNEGDPIHGKYKEYWVSPGQSRVVTIPFGAKWTKFVMWWIKAPTDFELQQGAFTKSKRSDFWSR